ncbi:MAG: class A beta-lactamase-related serine hydrolase [Calditrichaeota bacterium]|nr:MAG: class A beta-lactamase-related serine hydrolase [Calditrichota bacterium]MBL1207254.1 class A beta-lactamase-related serine hydrolase [Calditrichota bacterium]NOG47087.1 beta-lactamase family protein [Calditrichota bacterium]
MKQVGLLILILILSNTCSAQEWQNIKSLGLCLDSLVNNLILEKKIPSIAIGVVKDGKTVFAKGFGFANVEKEIPATKNTIYQLGSVTKIFTGYLLANLINKKYISLSDSIISYFPASIEFPISPTGQFVTIKDLATHSSEFPRYPENLKRIDPNPIKGYSNEEMLKGIELVSIDTVIGVRYNYSNFGYGVLGIAMENIMGKSLSKLMYENIFSTYSMKSTSLIFKDDFKDRLSIPYLEVSPYKRTEPWNMGALSGAGNVYSSILDLNKFMIIMLSNNEINKIQQSKYFKINETWSYGLGCFIVDSKKRNTQIIYHGGDMDGYASSLTLYLEHNLGIVILTNWGAGQIIGEAFTKINAEIENHYLGAI